MLDFLYLNGWGAFAVTMFFLIPFAAVFYYIVNKKSKAGEGATTTSPEKITQTEGLWLGLVVVCFIAINVFSIGYMPTVQTAEAAASPANIQQIDLEASSWSYDMSSQTVEVGRPVRFSGKSTDTMHGFAIYHPDGDVLFTMMLMPGLTNPTSIIHTFSDPGTYTVRCLEYCGNGHHTMTDELVVVSK
jgi:cytochrome c oxidase subunit II